MSEVLIVGGAGYIGSHIVLEFFEQHKKIVILDDLSTGTKNAILGGIFYQGCMSNQNLLGQIFSNHNISTVILLAGFINVNESIINPAKYYRNNVSNTLVLLDTMVAFGVLKIIFSSTAAIYNTNNLTEHTNCSQNIPQSPYAKSKLMIEQILSDYDSSYKLKSCILRYFNAAGADPKGRIGYHEPAMHLIPLALKTASGRKKQLQVFGGDYDTIDGTCVRDYIHVSDLASAHLSALNYLNKTNKSAIFDLGNGKGYSVKQVVSCVDKITGINISTKLTGRRKGDKPYVVANSSVAKKALNWQPKYKSLEEIIVHSWHWEQNKDWHD